MTDRVHSFTVVLREDTREDDAKCVADAIRMIKGVLSVKQNVSGLRDHVAYQRARSDLQTLIWNALREEKKP